MRTEPLSKADMTAISQRISDVVMSCLAMHHMAWMGMEEVDNGGAQWILVAIQEMAKANVKGLDACLKKIGESPAHGNFDDELEYEEAEVTA